MPRVWGGGVGQAVVKMGFVHIFLRFRPEGETFLGGADEREPKLHRGREAG